MTYKRLTKHKLFRLVYDKEVVIPLEFSVPIQCIYRATQMSNDQSLQKRLDEILELEEDRLIGGHSQLVKNQRQKA